MHDPLLHSFQDHEQLCTIEIPKVFPDPYSPSREPLAHLAAQELLDLLEAHEDIFSLLGLEEGQGQGNVGKMWGVLVVQTPSGQLAHLWALSGKLNEKTPQYFVPTLVDHLHPDSHFKLIESELLTMTQEMEMLQRVQGSLDIDLKISELKLKRKALSQAAQESIFDAYQMLSYSGRKVNIRQCYEQEAHSQPLSGSGDCCAPKLLQYAYQKGYQPISLAEFWWGPSPKASIRHSGRFYGACKGKCRPLLRFMLEGIAQEGEANFPNWVGYYSFNSSIKNAIDPKSIAQKVKDETEEKERLAEHRQKMERISTDIRENIDRKSTENKQKFLEVEF